MSYDTWLTREHEEREDYLDGLQEYVEKVAQDAEFDPHQVESFISAIQDGCLDPQPVMAELADAIAVGQSGFEKIGMVIWHAVTDHLWNRAEEEALKRIQSEKDDQY